MSSDNETETPEAALGGNTEAEWLANMYPLLWVVFLKKKIVQTNEDSNVDPALGGKCFF